jgi:hypothetical protein
MQSSYTAALYLDFVLAPWLQEIRPQVKVVDLLLKLRCVLVIKLSFFVSLQSEKKLFIYQISRAAEKAPHPRSPRVLCTGVGW